MSIEFVRTARDNVGYNNDMWKVVFDCLRPLQVGHRSRIRDLTEMVEDIIVVGLNANQYRKEIRRVARRRAIEKYGVFWW